MNNVDDYEESLAPSATADDWTPTIGLCRGALRGVIFAVVLAAVMAPIALYLPFMLTVVWIRVPLAFGLAWGLCQIVDRAAGMADLRCLALALGLTALALASNHLVFALYGVPETDGAGDWWAFPISLAEQIIPAQSGRLIGWYWWHPYVLLMFNGPALLIGGGFCAALYVRG